jgi:F0F1-type ATP synthase membrane subunit a
LLFLCYLRISGTAAVTSDGASNALQAWDMLHGNWLLKGWTLTDVSFYTTELPEYILVELLRGLGPADVHVSAAITYTLLVVLAGLLAKGNKTGREGLVRVLIASGIMIAPQVGVGAFLLLLSPDHAGTGVPLLLIFLLLDRAPRRWWVVALAGLMLVWVQVGDRLAMTIGAAPIVAVCVVRAYHGIVQRREPVRDRAFELGLAVAAIISVGVSGAVVKIVRHLGGYVTAPLNTTFAPSASWPAHLALAAEGVLGLYGADVTRRSLGFVTAIALVHLAGLALAAWAAGRAIRRFFSCDDLITQVLTLAIVVNLAAYVFSVLASTYWDNREIANVLPFGAVLAGRLLAGRLIEARLLPALTAVACCYGIALGYGVTRPQVPAHDQALAGWLAQHHLTTGLGSYAEGNSVTLDSHGAIQVFAPVWRPGSVRPGSHEVKGSQFDPGQHDASFVVTTTQDGPAFYLPPAWIIRDFGKPAHTDHYGAWTIMTWNKNLLTEVR